MFYSKISKNSQISRNSQISKNSQVSRKSKFSKKSKNSRASFFSKTSREIRKAEKEKNIELDYKTVLKDLNNEEAQMAEWTEKYKELTKSLADTYLFEDDVTKDWTKHGAIDVHEWDMIFNSMENIAPNLPALPGKFKGAWYLCDLGNACRVHT